MLRSIVPSAIVIAMLVVGAQHQEACKAAGKVALGKVAPGRLTPVLFVLRKSYPLERLPQGIVALPEY